MADKPSAEALSALQASDIETLLTKFAALTHRLHGMRSDDERAEQVRAQRDLIKHEIMVRTGDA